MPWLSKRALRLRAKMISIETHEGTLYFLPEYRHFFEKASWLAKPSEITLAGHPSNIVRTTIARGFLKETPRRSRKRELRLVFKSGTPARVEREFFNYLIIREEVPELRTLKPIGYFKAKDDSRSWLYTVLDQDIFPLHSLSFDSSSLTEENRRMLLHKLGKTASILHDKGYGHNDFKLKNVCYSFDYEPFTIVDLTKLTYSRNGAPNATRAFDLLNLLGTGIYKGLIRHRKDLITLLSAYVEKPGMQPNEVKARVSKWVDVLRERAEFYKRDKNIANVSTFLHTHFTKENA